VVIPRGREPAPGSRDDVRGRDGARRARAPLETGGQERSEGDIAGMTMPFVVLFAAFFIIRSFMPSPEPRVAERRRPDSVHNYKVVLSESGFWQSIGRVAYIGVIQIT